MIEGQIVTKKLNEYRSIFTTERYGIIIGLKYIPPLDRRDVIYTDTLMAVQTPAEKYTYHPLITEILWTIHVLDKHVTLYWLSELEGLGDNSITDRLAKIAAEQT